ncbi:RNA polymerase sigma factor [Paenibacillus rhizoplanae]
MQPLPAEDEGRQDSAGQAAVTRSAEMEYLGDRQVHEIWRLIMSLPDKLREVLVLDLKAELSVREIAELIRISPGTVKSRLHRARHKNPGQTEGDGVMDKREREPQWYELARKGPFPGNQIYGRSCWQSGPADRNRWFLTEPGTAIRPASQGNPHTDALHSCCTPSLVVGSRGIGAGKRRGWAVRRI